MFMINSTCVRLKSKVIFAGVAALLGGCVWALNDYYMSIGSWNQTAQTGSVAVGTGNQMYASGSLAIGSTNVIATNNVLTCGTGLSAANFISADSMVLGRYNKEEGFPHLNSVGLVKHFAVGNGFGSSSSQRRNAFEVLEDGRLILNELGRVSLNDLPGIPYASFDVFVPSFGVAWPVTDGADTSNSIDVPEWWSSIIDPSSPTGSGYEPATFGQFRSVVRRAKMHFDSVFPGGAGAAITAVDSILKNDSTDSLQVITIGQLKNAVKPFYERLLELDGLHPAQLRFGTQRYLAYLSDDNSQPIPLWDTSVSGDQLQIAAVAQLKRAFSFDYDSDLDGDGLPRWWEQKYMRKQWSSTESVVDKDGSGHGWAVGANGDFDCDGKSNIQEWNDKTDPGRFDSGGFTIAANQILIVYSKDYTPSENVKDYYLNNRPGFKDSQGNVLPSTLGLVLGSTFNERIDFSGGCPSDR